MFYHFLTRVRAKVRRMLSPFVRGYYRQAVMRRLETELRPCPLCGGDRFEPLDRRERFGLPLRTQRCMACGLVMQNPMPTERFLKRFYSSRTYFGLCHGVLWPSEPAVSKGSEAGRVNAGFFAEVAALGIVRPGDGFRLLDVGAGTLHFLAGVRRDFPSIRAYALEPGAAFAKPRRQILDGSYKDIDSLPDGTSFDVITAWHVLEHLREPVRALKRLKRNLKPGGWLLLEVPDFGKYAWAPEWRKLHHLGHQYHFTRLTLRRTLEAAGFRDIGFCDRRLQHEVGVKAIAKA